MRDGVVPLLTRMLDNGAEGVRVGGALALAGLAANNEDCQVLEPARATADLGQ